MTGDSKNRVRVVFWDNLKGFLIFLVVFAHVIYDRQEFKIIDFLADNIYIFHMPAFVFVSGYFSKSDHSKNGRSLFKLLSAYLVLTLIHLIMSMATGKNLKILQPYYFSWYLLSLIAWRLLARTSIINSKPLIISVLATVGIGFWSDVNNTLALARTVSLFPFFAAGYCLTKDRVEQFRSKTGKRIFVGAAAAILAEALFCFVKITFNIRERDYLFSAYGENYINNLTIRVFILLIASLFIIGLLLLMPNKRIPFLTKIGKNSFSIYTIHRPVTLLLARFFTDLSEPNILIYSLILTAVLLLILGSDPVMKAHDRVLDYLADGWQTIVRNEDDRSHSKNRIVLLILLAMILLAPIINKAIN